MSEKTDQQEVAEVLDLVNSVEQPAVFREKMEAYGEEVENSEADDLQ